MELETSVESEGKASTSSIPDGKIQSHACHACNSVYTSHDSLKRHVRNKHPDQIKYLPPKLRSSKLYKCDFCMHSYSDIRNLRFHVKNIHNICDTNDDDGHSEKECPICHFKAGKNEMHVHFENSHDIKTEYTVLNFDKYDAFDEWKGKCEKETSSKFIKICGAKSTKKVTTHYFICHRSGYYVCKGTSQRNIKTQGSNKINGYCPAGMKLETDESGACKVTFCSTHIGHKNDIGHLLLTDLERQSIAAKIASKAPFECILDDIRDSVSASKLERIHLLTKKDLYNIEKCYNVGSEAEAVKHKNDALSVEAWVAEMEKSCVSFYKPQDTLNEMYPELKKEDFVLIVMNEAQGEMLKKYDSHICIDGTHGTNSYDFELITLLVLDDMRQGFPCAFLISNRSDSALLKIFFSKIKEKVGEISPSVFMSDMADSFYNAWSDIFNKPKHRLYCTWHVDRAWRRNLSKINMKDMQVEVYKMIRTLMEETDEKSFTIMYENCVQKLLQNNLTAEFGKYFAEYYGKCVQTWAFCYRMKSGLNTNMHIERMHRTLKYIYLKGKQAKRLDKTLYALMKFVKDKIFDRLITLHKGKLTAKLQHIRARHKESQTLSFDLVNRKENSYEVFSSSLHDIYVVEEEEKNCTCKLLCTDCKACLHNFSCTCIDASIKWNMCKHIHLVCQFRLADMQPISSNLNNLNNEQNELCIDTEDEIISQEESFLISEVSEKKGPSTNLSLSEQKEHFKKELLQILDDVSNEEELKIFMNAAKSVTPTITAYRNSKVKSLMTCEKKSAIIPHNKNIETQRRLFATRKRKRKDDHALKKPNEEESKKFAFSLINNEK